MASRRGSRPKETVAAAARRTRPVVCPWNSAAAAVTPSAEAIAEEAKAVEVPTQVTPVVEQLHH